MNKNELVDKVAANAKITKKEAQAAIDATTNVIIEAVKKGDKVTLVGFGTFSAVKRAARNGRNPQTGKAMKIPSRKAPKFVAGKTFREKVKK